MEGDRVRCMEAGMDGYISKPLDRADLIGQLDRFLAARRGIGDGVDF